MEEILVIIFVFVAIFVVWCLCDISSECSKIEEENKNKKGDDDGKNI